MTYPKPLSEKTLLRMYEKANINEKKSEFLHNFFLASANLYGIVVLRHLCDIFEEVSKEYKVNDITKEDLISFSAIARREDAPYYVYEIDELYSEEKRCELDREIVHKSLVTPMRKKSMYYDLAEEQADKPYYIPKKFLSYVNPKISMDEINLLNYLKSLKVTAKTSENRYGRKFTCEHIGKTLGNFSYRSFIENELYDYYNGAYSNHPSKNERYLNEIIENTSGSEAEKLVRRFKKVCNTGCEDLTQCCTDILDEINVVGVQLSEKQVKKLMNLLMIYNNNSHLWINRGWKPSTLARQSQHDMPTALSLGPGIQKEISEGKINREELEEYCRRFGIDLIG